MTVRIELGESSYDVVLEPGCLSHAGELLDLDRKVLVVKGSDILGKYVAKQTARPGLTEEMLAQAGFLG